MEGILKILFVEDFRSDVELVWRELKYNNIEFSKKLVDNRVDYLSNLELFAPDIIVSDYSLPQFDGMAALRIRNEKSPDTPFILVTGSNNETIAVECMKAGADDYILKDNLSRLAPAIKTAVNKIKLLREKNTFEAALFQSEAKYRKIFENTQDVFYETSFDGKILEMSPSIENLSRGYYQRNDLIGKSIYDFYIEPSDRKLLLKELIEKGSVTDYEVLFSNGDQSVIQCSISAKIFIDDQGNPENVIGSMRDITERKNAENELIKAKEKAEENDRLKTAFLSNISHEIRTPMNGILGFAELLKELDLEVEEQKEYIEIIKKSGERMLNIINDIIDISKIEAGIIENVCLEIDLHEQIEFVNSFFKPLAEEKGITISARCNLQKHEAVVATDGKKLNSILTNLVKNAIKFTQEGSIEFGCGLKSSYPNEISDPAELEFYVKDSGIGIPKDRQVAIFERFVMADVTDKMAWQGAGLGLTISQAYVEALGGKIWVESEEGKGSTFFFTLPYLTATKE